MADPRLSITTLGVLRLFMDAPKSALSGADVMKRTHIFSGTLYPMLSRLEEAGWLSSTWEDVDPSKVGRPRRRLYRITALGQNSTNRALLEHGVVFGGQKAWKA